jgi:hypothetical protein
MFLVLLSVSFLYEEENSLSPHIGHDSVTVGIRRKSLWKQWAVPSRGASACERKLCSCVHECERAYQISIYDHTPERLHDSTHYLLEDFCSANLPYELGKWATWSWLTALRKFKYKRGAPCISLQNQDKKKLNLTIFTPLTLKLMETWAKWNETELRNLLTSPAFLGWAIPLSYVRKEIKKLTGQSQIYLDTIFIVEEATCFGLFTNHQTQT